MFARLAVFAGGFTLAASAAVAGDGDELATMRLIGRLVDKSLVRVDRSGESDPRYAMLETVREFARAELASSGEAAVVERRHRDHFVGFARTAQAELLGAGTRAWTPRIAAELPNLLAACAACDGTPDGVATGLDLAANLRTFWLAVGRFEDGLRVYEQALARPGGDPRSHQRGKTLYALGQHHYVFGRLQDALAPTREALAIAREHGDDELVVYCLDRIGLASTWLGDVASARTCADDELRVATRTGNERLIGFALTAQGAACRAEGNLDAAAEAYEAALAVFIRGTDRHNRHNALVDVARVAVARGDFARARTALGGAIDLVVDMGTMYRGHFALAAGARLAAARGQWLRAAALQGASDMAVDAAGGVRTWFDDRVLAALQEQPARMLGADTYAATYATGRAQPIATTLAEVAAWLRDDAAWLAVA
jgi:tetratricopeptide (TPR) repeat protein